MSGIRRGVIAQPRSYRLRGGSLKNILWAFALVLIPASASGDTVTINQGETYTFYFDSLPNPTSITSEPGAWVNIPLLGFQGDDQVQLTAYENSLADVPFFDANFHGGSRGKNSKSRTGMAAALTAPAFAGIPDAKNKADCEKADGVWIDKDKKCGAKKQY
jgi:hypothetical protein